jgi:formylglycine-generating enzyme required for sulfatase activity/serine/threonine protein kinase
MLRSLPRGAMPGITIEAMSAFDEAAAIANKFLLEVLEDRASGVQRPLSDYQSRYPGFEAAIEEEFYALGKGTAPPRADSSAPRSALDAGSLPVWSLTEFLDAMAGSDRSEVGELERLLDGQVSTLAQLSTSHPGPGETFGAYRILGEIGRGGQGVVLLAQSSRPSRLVALKLLHARGPDFAQAFARFRREAESAAKLDHPGICAVYETGITGGVPFIAMPRVEGETLARHYELTRAAAEGVPPRQQEIQRLLSLFEGAARALHAAHEAGIVHRDIKPGNIMVTPDERAVLLDFGLARDDEAGATVTLTGDVLGTPAYVAPELLASSATIRADRRVDVWSLGVALFEGVTGQRPFEAATREGLFRAIVSEELPDPRRLNPAIDRDLKVVLETAIQRDRDCRYRTALALAEDLRRIRDREPILARPTPKATRLIRWAQRNPIDATLTAAVFVALVSGLVTTLVQKSRADDHADEARRNLGEYERLADLRHLDDLLQEEQDLWPAVPARMESMRRWLDRARELAARLNEHEEALVRLRSMAEPPADEDKARDRASHRAELEHLAVLAVDVVELEKQRDALEPSVLSQPWTEKLRKNLAQQLTAARTNLASEEQRLEPMLSERLTWVFLDPTSAWRHEKLAELVARLNDFVSNGPELPGLKGMEARLEFARTLTARTVEDHAQAWQACLDRIARNREYAAGTLTSSLVGLIPLGPDPATNLEEFCETATGVPPRREPASGNLVLNEGTALVFVLLPGGKFRMGAQCADPALPNFALWAEDDESPVHEVTLTPFLISKYEMTQGQWLRATGSNPSFHRGLLDCRHAFDLRNPVEQVSWVECTHVLARLDLCLPTEEQWEYSCRAGTDTPWHTGKEFPSLAGVANIAGEEYAEHFRGAVRFQTGFYDSSAHPVAVGSHHPNRFGLYEMHGNVSEWCEDEKEPYNRAAQSEDGLRFSTTRIHRGGSFFDAALLARSSNRADSIPARRRDDLGLRPARRLEP